jgi:hypothetical protein
MEDIKLNSAQKTLFPFLLSLVGALIALIGLFTPWISIGDRSVGGTDSDQGKYTFFVIAVLVVLGISTFVAKLKLHSKVIALVSGFICIDVLISYAFWANRIRIMTDIYNDATEELDDTNSLFGGALTDIAKAFEPSITSGFYMVCVGVLIGLLSSILIFKSNDSDSYAKKISDVHADSKESVLMESKKNYFGIPQIQFFGTIFIGILGLTLVILRTDTSELTNPLKSDSSSTSSAADTSSTNESSKVFDCIKVENLRNVIKLNQPSYSGELSPTDTFVATQFKISNNCSQTVVGIKGSVDFQNVVGDTIFTGAYTDDKSIPVGEFATTSLTYGWTFNQFEDEHGQLAVIDEAKTKAVMTLTKVVFGDGTALSE